MSIKPIILLCALLLTACSDQPQDKQERNARQYDEKILALGDRTYNTHCATCHGHKGEGQPGWQQPGPDGKLMPPPLDDKGRSWRLSSSQIKEFIRQGSPHGRGNMPAWQGKLSDQEIDAVATWITSLWSDATFLQWHTQVEKQVH
ncbi:MAG: cytochrome c [Sulfurimicrobium sp.]|nr:cytochrome c [Sulfurimicrobium sp.]MDP2198928.1 cytochrome c [Sulfurimicrobium sp.]